MLIQPLPFVRKNMLLSLFQEISLTSNLNCSSALERCVLASMNVTTSSLLPTAMVCPSGLQQILMFSPGNPDTISKILLAYNPPEVYLVIKERLELLPRVHSLRSSSVGPTRTPAYSSTHFPLQCSHVSKGHFSSPFYRRKTERDGPKYQSYEVTEPRSKCILNTRASNSLLYLHFPNSSHSHAIFTIFELSM